MATNRPSFEGSCAHESVQLFGRADAVGCMLATLRCADCGQLLHGEGST